MWEPRQMPGLSHIQTRERGRVCLTRYVPRRDAPGSSTTGRAARNASVGRTVNAEPKETRTRTRDTAGSDARSSQETHTAYAPAIPGQVGAGGTRACAANPRQSPTISRTSAANSWTCTRTPTTRNMDAACAKHATTAKPRRQDHSASAKPEHAGARHRRRRERHNAKP